MILNAFRAWPRVLGTSIRGVHVNPAESTVAVSDFDILVCAETNVSGLAELHVPGFRCSQQRLRNSTPGAQRWL